MTNERRLSPFTSGNSKRWQFQALNGEPLGTAGTTSEEQSIHGTRVTVAQGQAEATLFGFTSPKLEPATIVPFTNSTEAV